MSDLLTTTYTDHRGIEHEAVQLTWAHVEHILGRRHRHTAEDDAILTAAIRAMHALAWIDTAMVAETRHGWYLVGPAVPAPA